MAISPKLLMTLIFSFALIIMGGCSSDDNDTTLAKGATLSESTLTIAEDAQEGTYTIKLNILPTETVRVALSSLEVGVATVLPTHLDFTTENWDEAQTVTVTTVDDKIDQDTDRTTEIKHIVSGGDYGEVSIANLNVTATDDDTRGVTVSESTRTVGESAGTATYTVKLNSEPTGTVTVTPVSGLETAATVGDALEFTTGNWNDAQEVTVRGVNDDIDNPSDARTAVITHAASGTGTDYASGVTAEEVTVTVTDNDTKGFTFSTQSISAAESSGNSGNITGYTLKLDSEPTGVVTVDLTGTATLLPSTMTFNAGNWGTPKDVRVTTVDDLIDQGTATYTVTITHTASGAGSGYESGVTPETVALTVTDNDTKELIVSSQALTVSEPSTTLAYTIKLGTQPTATVRLIPSSTPGATVTPAYLDFTATSWNEGQKVTVRAVDDDIDNPSDRREATITHALTGTGSGYESGVTARNVTVTITDDDTKGLTLWSGGSEISTLSVGESAAATPANQVSYTVKLSSEPTGNVEVAVAETSDAITLDKTSLTFTTANWSDPQTVTVTGVDDTTNQNAANRTARINHSASGSDYATYTTVLLLTVTVVDDADTRAAFSSKVLADERTSDLPFDPTRIKKELALWLDNTDERETLLSGEDSVPSLSPTEWPTLSDILVAQEGRELGELFAVTGREGELDLLSFIYPYSLFIEEMASHDFGELREVVIYDESLEESERAKLERYLSCRWQLPMAGGECL